MPTDLILRLALDGSDVECVERLGLRHHQVVQRALRLVGDPAVGVEYPQLVARFQRVRVQRMKARSSSRLHEGRG